MKFPFSHQLDSNDCGPACLKMIYSYYGREISLRDIREKCDPDFHGVTIKGLTEAAKSIGFQTESVLLSLMNFKKMPLPVILYWNQNHFVVLYKIDLHKQLFYIADPSFGKLKLDKKTFFEGWIGTNVDEQTKGIVILLELDEDLPRERGSHNKDNKEATIQIFKYLKNISKKYSKKYLFSLAFVCIALLLNWTIPILFQKTIDSGISLKNLSLIKLFILGQVACSIGYFIFSTLYDLILLKINFKISTAFLEDFLSRVIRLPLVFFLRRVSSDLLQRIQDLELLQIFLTRHVIKFLITLANFLLFLTLLGTYSVIILIIYLIISLIIFGWIGVFFKKRAVLDYSRFIALSEYRNNYFELISGMPDIKINNASEAKVHKTKNILHKTNNLLLKTLYVENYQIIGVNILDNLKNYLIIGLCAYWVVGDTMSLGEMISVNYIIGQLSGSLMFFTNFARDFQDAQISMTRLNEINTTHSLDSQPIGLKDISFNHSMSFSNVCFKYSSNQEQYILKNVSFNIPKGKVTAIVGESGSGKTTILKLLLGFYAINSGKLLIDNCDFKNISIDSWRENCGAVLQDGFLFSGTFVENIALSEITPDLPKVKYAAEMACIDKFIESLPMKYNTIIGKNGVMLSGGEKQRILIARAIYKNPQILFLDEATNSLDSTNELRINNNLNVFYSNKTVVIIAHRLSTIRNADNIIVLDSGEVAEIGTHNKLMNNHGVYYHLIENQLK